MAETCKHPWASIGIVFDGGYQPEERTEVSYCFACCERLTKAEVKRSRFIETIRLGDALALATYDLRWGDANYPLHWAAYKAAQAAYAEFTAVHSVELPI